MSTINQLRVWRWYEGLCRHAISRVYRMPVEEVYSGHLKGAGRKRRKLRHQIDLFWKATDGVCEYEVFANAKWRHENVDLPDMMALIGVWRDIAAHKAMMITNTGFDIGVVNQAIEKGIGLMVVRPKFELAVLKPGKLEAIVEEIEGMAAGREEALFEMEMVHKAFGGTEAQRHEGTEGRALRDIGLEGESGGGGEGETEGGSWVLEGGDGGGEIEGVEDKGMESGQVSNKMMGGVWKKG